MMFIRMVGLVLILNLTLAVGGKKSAKRVKADEKKLSPETKLVKKLLKDYERIAPTPGPTTVELGIYINSIDSINEQSMDYTLNIYLRQKWRDQRLRFDPINNATDEIKLPNGMWRKIWVPDTFFRNEKRATFHDVTVPNRLLRLSSDGTVWYATKLTATLSCIMHLKKYPLDTQRCPILFESFGYTTKTLKFTWMTSPAPVEFERLVLPQFIWQNYSQENCSKSYVTGDYPCLKLNLHLKRDKGYYFIQLYVPSFLVIVLSWVSFWISIDAVPARVTIGLLTVLTMTTQTSYANSQLPRVSYIKAADVWMATCLVFVFASLIEYAIVNVFSRHESENKVKTLRHLMVGVGKRKTNGSAAPFMPVPTQNNGCCHDDDDDGDDEKCSTQERSTARYIDGVARVLFPLAFFIFNATYWIVYLFIIDDESNDTANNSESKSCL